MITGNSFLGFVSGFVSAFLVLLGTWYLWLARSPRPIPQKDSIRDLSHYGRPLRKNRRDRRSR